MLVQFIREEFPGIPLEPIGRRYWNDAGGRPHNWFPANLDKCSVGLEFIMQLCVEDDERAGTVLAVSNK